MESLFLIALQSSLFLGLIHGINPCGHSWIVLALSLQEIKAANGFSL